MAEEYPRNLTELESNFSTEEACRAYLVRLRWPDGFRCPRCGHGRSWPVRGVLLECASCGCQTSVTAGTIFQGHVVGNDAEERSQRVGTATSTGAEKL